MSELITPIVSAITGSALTALVLIGYLIKNPEKVEKWGAIVYKCFSYVNKKYEKNYMTADIQSTINIKKKNSGLGENVLSYDVKIKWTDEESVDIDLKEKKVLIMMKPLKNESKNLAHIVSLYVPKSLLPKSRRYINQNLMKSIDYIIGKTLLEDNSAALEYYSESESKYHDNEIKTLLEEVEPIHEHGRLTRIVINEFQRLSGLYPSEPDPALLSETYQFVKTLSKFESAPQGSTEAQPTFHGNYINISVIPVGKGVTIDAEGIIPHFKFIEKEVKQGGKLFYIVAAGNLCVFAKSLKEKTCRELNLNLVSEDNYWGKFRGKKRKMYCALCIVTDSDKIE
jgi:hypothetical protein